MSRALTEAQFVDYYAGEHCLCQNDKMEKSAMCADCREVLAATNPGLLHVIENGTGEPLYQGLGEFRDLVRKAAGE